MRKYLTRVAAVAVVHFSVWALLAPAMRVFFTLDPSASRTREFVAGAVYLLWRIVNEPLGSLYVWLDVNTVGAANGCVAGICFLLGNSVIAGVAIASVWTCIEWALRRKARPTTGCSAISHRTDAV
jgi:hypothetical protein